MQAADSFKLTKNMVGLFSDVYYYWGGGGREICFQNLIFFPCKELMALYKDPL